MRTELRKMVKDNEIKALTDQNNNTFVIENFSANGLGCYFLGEEHFEKGQEIVFNYKKFVIKWIKHTFENFKKIGLAVV